MTKMLHTKAIVEKQNVSETGVIDAIIGSSAVIDRMGDIIVQDGWKLKNFQANPVILWAHNSGLGEDRPPIGKALKVWVEDKGKKNARLMFKVQMDLQDPFAADIFRKIKEGYINTVSVGFMPTEWEELDPDNWFGGLKYLEQELLELSFVPVPANPEALVQLNSFASEEKKFGKPVENIESFYSQQKDNRDKKMMKESKAVSDDKVLNTDRTDEYTVSLKDISEFELGSFRAMPMKKEEKEYVVIVGKIKGTDQYVEQSLRFKAADWTTEEIEEHSKNLENKEVEEVIENAEKETEEVIEKAEEADAEITDNTDLKEVTAKDLKGMMQEVWKDGYEAGDESDDTKGMAQPEDDMKVKAMKVGQAKALMNDCFSGMKPTKALEEQETVDVKSIQDMFTKAVEKSGRVLSSKNENKVRQAMDLLDSVLTELDKEEIEDEASEETPKENAESVEKNEEVDSKKVIPYKNMGTLPESETWDGPGEVAKAEVEDLKIMCAWFDEEKADDKSSYKLPHHKADGEHKAVWRGVAAAMGALLGARGGSDIPEDDRKGVYNHLKKHYEEFGKDVPEFKSIEDQVLAGFGEEIQALTLDREEKHMVRLIKRVLENQKEDKKKEQEVKSESPATNSQVLEALKIINLALSKVDLTKGDKN